MTNVGYLPWHSISKDVHCYGEEIIDWPYEAQGNHYYEEIILFELTLRSPRQSSLWRNIIILSKKEGTRQ